MSESHALEEVLEFYKTLPFNYRESVEGDIAAIRSCNAIEAYPPFASLLSKGKRVLEIGCGSGWFSNGISFHYGSDVTALDFNPVVIERAKGVAQALGVGTKFIVGDLFKYMPEEPFDIAVSLGVLHHTADCMSGVRHICRHCVKDGGHIMIGLYHKYGRKPFLDHFAEMARSGASEKKMLKEYGKLHSNIKDKTHLQSWFRDQVLHPHETQHTQKELGAVLGEEGFELKASSINRFQPFSQESELHDLEQGMEEIGKKKLKMNQYYPGFFVAIAQKTAPKAS